MQNMSFQLGSKVDKNAREEDKLRLIQSTMIKVSCLNKSVTVDALT